jgi:hypothetical protein
MGKVYEYRRIVGVAMLSLQGTEQQIARLRAARGYDYLYQFSADDEAGIPWQMGMVFPRMAMEEGYPQRLAVQLGDVLDHWMARFMLKNRVRWIQEKQRGQ